MIVARYTSRHFFMAKFAAVIMTLHRPSFVATTCYADRVVETTLSFVLISLWIAKLILECCFSFLPFKAASSLLLFEYVSSICRSAVRTGSSL